MAFGFPLFSSPGLVLRCHLEDHRDCFLQLFSSSVKLNFVIRLFYLGGNLDQRAGACSKAYGWGSLERSKLTNECSFHSTIPYFVKIILRIFLQQLMSKSLGSWRSKEVFDLQEFTGGAHTYLCVHKNVLDGLQFRISVL